MTAAEELQQEAKIQNTKDIAKKMLHEGIDIHVIAKVTDFSLEEIEKLKTV